MVTRSPQVRPPRTLMTVWQWTLASRADFLSGVVPRAVFRAFCQRPGEARFGWKLLFERPGEPVPPSARLLRGCLRKSRRRAIVSNTNPKGETSRHIQP